MLSSNAESESSISEVNSLCKGELYYLEPTNTKDFCTLRKLLVKIIRCVFYDSAILSSLYLSYLELH